ncbi:hemicentin-1-like isoform X2 [Limulus polyphemus]|uniref:Hemicentin-1-like isoform X2 n=1 Tax=Limulus polyphemus TaxID=6850 RepID=A0ABM1SNC8_LIMPO|nr:hemicentin-1-like isoform X2 [Limulus polyphemus]
MLCTYSKGSQHSPRRKMMTSICFVFLFSFHLWPVFSGAHVRQKPASKEKPYASILYTAVVRGKVALPCDISSPSTDDSAALILWYKDDSAQPIYTLDARRGNVDQAHQSSGHQLENRAYFNMINRPAFLQLDPVKEEDAGEYRCRVDFHKARTVNTVITLKVIVPSGEPVITDEQGRQLKGLIGPFNEGDSLQLTCQVSGGKPRPSLTWWREYTILDDDYSFTPEDVVKNDLKISELKRHDLLTVFTCQASNNNITVPSASAVTLDLNLKPVEVKIHPYQRPLPADKEVDLTCSSNGSRPAAKITWWKGDKQMQHTRESVNRAGVSTSILTFMPSVEDNGKQLSCKTENPHITNSAIEDSWKLEIYFPPQVTLHLRNNPTSSEIQEGNDVYLDCNIQANPWVHSISWQFEERELKKNFSAGINISNQTLVVQRVQLSHRGHFTCSASNTEGLGISNKIFINVKYAPQCQAGQKTAYGVAVYEKVGVTCSLDADPDDVTFSWLFNSSTKQSSQIQYSSDKTQSVATYTPETEDDYGTLLCWGTNDIGIQRKPCVFTIVPAGPPESPHNCSVLNQTENLIYLECVEGDNGGLNANFILEVFSVGHGTLQANITSPVPMFLVKELPAGTALRLLVFAANPKGRSEPVVISATTLRPAEKLMDKGHPQSIVNVQPLFTILIAVVVTLVLIVVVVVIVLKVKRKRTLSRAQTDQTDEDKSQMPLKKDIDDLTDLDDKGPDIIPSRTFYRASYPEYPEEGDDRCLQLNSTMESCYSTPDSKSGNLIMETTYTTTCPVGVPADRVESFYPTHSPSRGHISGIDASNKTTNLNKLEDVTYAELALPRSGQSSSVVRRQEPPTEYAKIDFRGKQLEAEEEECGVSCETPLMNNRRESAV